MQLVQLQYVVKIAENHSISSAARELFIAQPTISEALKSFEKEMGFKIFERNSRGVKLTEKGRKVYLIAKNVDKNIDELENFSKIQKNIKIVRIASVPMVSGTIFLNLLNFLYKKFPNVTIYPDELRPHQVLREFTNRNLDIALCSKRRVDQTLFTNFIHDNLVEYQILCKVPLVAVVSSQSQLAKYKEITRAELLKKGRFIGLSDYYNFNNQTNALCLSNRDLILNSIAHNNGVTVIPKTALIGNRYFNSKQIVTISMPEEEPEPLSIIYPSSKIITPIQDKIVKTIINCIEQLEY